MGKRKEPTKCPVEATPASIGDKWKITALQYLTPGTKHFCEHIKSIEPISQEAQAGKLRKMEDCAFLSSKVCAKAPRRVESSPTESGRRLNPILAAMKKWGAACKKNTGN